MYRTLGERRLSTHLLEGLTMLIPLVVPTVDKTMLLSVFSSERFGPYIQGKTLKESRSVLASQHDVTAKVVMLILIQMYCISLCIYSI